MKSISPLLCGLLKLLVLAGPTLSAAAANEPSFKNGVPTYTVYEADLIGANDGISSLTQDRLGRLVATSGSDLIIFDGNYWSKLRQKPVDGAELQDVNTIVFLPNGDIFCSAARGIYRLKLLANEFYQLSPIGREGDPETNLGYSALDNAFVQKNSVFFHGLYRTCKYDMDTGTLINDPIVRQTSGRLLPFGDAIVEHGSDTNIYIHDTNREIVKISTSRWRGDDTSARSATVWNESLILGYDYGLGILQNDRLVKWESELEGLDSNNISLLAPMSDQELIVGVLSRGLYLVNRNGQIIHGLERSQDYRFGQIRNLLKAENGIVWASSGRNLIRVEFNSPITNYSQKLDAATFYPKVFFHDQALHVVTDGKLLRAERYQGGMLKGYTLLAHGINGAGLIGEHIFLTTENEVQTLNLQGDLTSIANIPGIDHFAELGFEGKYAIGAGRGGVHLFEQVDGQWRYTGQKAESTAYAYYSVRDPEDGALWIENGLAQVTHVRVHDGKLDSRTYGTQEGLPRIWVNIWNYQNRVHFSVSPEDILNWNRETETFEAAQGDAIEKISSITEHSRAFEDSRKNVWVPSYVSGHTIFRADAEGGIHPDRHTLRRLSGERITHVMELGDGAIWLTARSNIFRYDPQLEKQTPALAAPVIHRFESPLDERVIYDWEQGELPASFQIPYSQNSLNIFLTNTDISQTSQVSHEYRIGREDTPWSRLPSPNELRLSRLKENDYEIQFRATTDGSEYSPPTILKFTIAPPFYRSAAAYTLYAIVAVLIIYLQTRWILARANKRNQRLQAMYEKAHAADIAKTAFLATMSHEMRTPLNAIIGPVELLQLEIADKEQKNYLRIIREAGDQMLSFVNDVLDYVSTGANETALRKDAFDLAQLVHSQIDFIKERATAKGLLLSLEMAEDFPRIWIGDERSVLKLLGNLLNNALKFTEKGSIRIILDSAAARAEPPQLRMTIVDTGIGIKDSDRESVFEVFHQLDNSLDRKYEGSGLGLAICKQAVEQLGGEIDFKSELGKGTRFWFTLPFEPLLEPQSSQS